ncbi:MAG: polyprenyl synthetase family protein [Deltaproteobacteria bacterium]|nr:polyprenyl synthetase family protein [Deltaproteobacteria bacterium]
MPSLINSSFIVDALAEVESIMLQTVDVNDVAGGFAAEHLQTGGKRLRARLAFAAVNAFAAAREVGINWAAVCELVHNATLVHDDLQDGDEQRRGQTTVWARHGAIQAINVGDLMLIAPYSMVEKILVPDTIRWQLCYALSTRTVAVIRGQAQEQALRSHDSIDWHNYDSIAIGKTSALFELPVLGAALIAGYDSETATMIAEPFAKLGLLFQMQDDVLDLYGNKGRDLVGSDLYEGKVSCLVVAHLLENSEEQAELLTLLRTERQVTKLDDVTYFIKRFREGGALKIVLKRIETLQSTIKQHPAWQHDNRLTPLAEELMQLMMEPIAHLASIVQ